MTLKNNQAFLKQPLNLSYVKKSYDSKILYALGTNLSSHWYTLLDQAKENNEANYDNLNSDK